MKFEEPVPAIQDVVPESMENDDEETIRYPPSGLKPAEKQLFGMSAVEEAHRFQLDDKGFCTLCCKEDGGSGGHYGSGNRHRQRFLSWYAAPADYPCFSRRQFQQWKAKRKNRAD